MKKYVVPLFLAACLLLTACGPKAPDTAEPSAEPTAAEQERRGKGAQPLAPFRREGYGGDLYP